MSPDVFGVSFLRHSHPVLDLRESLLDGVEVGRVFGQEPEPCAGGSDRFADGFGFVAAEIIHDDDIARLQRWYEDLLYVSTEADTIDGAVEDARGGEPVAAQGANEGECPPAPVRCEAPQPFALWPPTAQRRHIAPDPGLIDEDQPIRVKTGLPALPAPAMAGDVCPRLLKGEQGFF